MHSKFQKLTDQDSSKALDGDCFKQESPYCREVSWAFVAVGEALQQWVENGDGALSSRTLGIRTVTALPPPLPLAKSS